MLRRLADVGSPWGYAAQPCRRCLLRYQMTAATAAATETAPVATAATAQALRQPHARAGRLLGCSGEAPREGTRFLWRFGRNSSSSSSRRSSSSRCCFSPAAGLGSSSVVSIRAELRAGKRSISTLINKLPRGSPVSVCADGFETDGAFLQRMQQALASQLVEAFEYYGIPQKEEQQQDAAGPRVGLLLPPSAVWLAALAAVAAVGGVAVPLPFADAAVAVETATAATAAAGGVAAAAAARPVAAAIQEVGGELFITKSIGSSSSLLSSSKALRLLQQQLAETQVQLLLVHPALAAAAALLSQQLGLHACICGQAVPAATDICLLHEKQQQQQQQQQRLFVRQIPRYSSGLTARIKWLPLRCSDGSSAGNLRDLQEALVALDGASSSSSSSSGSSSSSSNSTSSSSTSSSSSNSKETISYSLLADASRCWGLPRAAVLSAAALQQQLQRNAQQLLRHMSPGDTAVVAAAAAAFTKPKLLLALLLPLLQQQAKLLLITRQKRETLLPLPLQVALQQQAAQASAEALAAQTPAARAAAVWQLLLQHKQQQQQERLTVVLDLETAEAMLAVYEHAATAAAAAIAATVAPTEAAAAATHAPLAAATELAAAASQGVCCCCICTDESDLVSMRGQAASSSGSKEGVAAAATPPAARIAAVFKGWERLLPPSAFVQHVLSVSEVGIVAMQQQRGRAGDSEVLSSSDEEQAAAAAKNGFAMGHLMPGVSAQTAEGGRLVFSSSSSSSGYFGRPRATAEAFEKTETASGAFFRSALLGEVGRDGEIRVLGCTYTAAQPLQRPLEQRLQQWQWGLPRMERLIEGYVHKVPITGKEWGNYHAKKRHWKRIF